MHWWLNAKCAEEMQLCTCSSLNVACAELISVLHYETRSAHQASETKMQSCHEAPASTWTSSELAGHANKEKNVSLRVLLSCIFVVLCFVLFFLKRGGAWFPLAIYKGGRATVGRDGRRWRFTCTYTLKLASSCKQQNREGFPRDMKTELKLHGPIS